MKKIKINTYLREKELTDIQIKSIIEKLNVNPEELLSTEIQEKIDKEIEVYKKPQKKLVIKRKIIKKTSLKTEEQTASFENEEELVETPVKKETLVPDSEVVLSKNIEAKEEVKFEKVEVKAERPKIKKEKEKIEEEKAEEVTLVEEKVKKHPHKEKSEEIKTEEDTLETKEKILKQTEKQIPTKEITTSSEPEKTTTSFSYNKKYTYTPSSTASKTETEHHKKRIYIKKPVTKEDTTTKKTGPYGQQRQFNYNKTFKTTPVMQIKPEVSNYQNKKKKTGEIEYETLEKDELHNKLTHTIRKKKETEFAIPEEIEIPESITVSDLAKKMNIKANVLIQKLFEIGNTVTINQVLDADTAEILLSYFNCKVKRTSIMDSIKIPIQADIEPMLKKRPPIVTVLGHVDHGKTTLLDKIRKTNVADGEVGGITQRIGAYKVKVKGEEIVFIDTPGHEAFTSMRARGASVTDIAILIVAADDGVMPQTIEALNHAKAAKVPIIVAINKCDKPGAKIEKIKTDLSNLDLLPQEWGGDTIYVQISALKGTGIDELLDSILLIAELLDLKADYNPKKWAEGVILESRLDKGRGIIATVLVKNGVLKERDVFIAGNYEGKVRSMTDENGKKLTIAYPSTPVEVIGFEQLPDAGSIFSVVDSEKTAKEIARKRREIEILEKQKESNINLANILSKINKGEVGQLNIIIKADVQGMAEALKASCEKLSVQKINVNVIHFSVGAITESDINLAITSKAIIIGFNTKPTKEAQLIAEREGVEIRRYNIIYDVIEDIKNSISGLAAPKIREEVIGEVEIRQIFKIPSIGVVGGGFVTKGVITKDSLCRVYRENVVIFTGKISTLYHFQNPVREVKQGLECGLTIEKFNDLNEGDILELYKNVEEKVNFEELVAMDNKEKEDAKKESESKG
ncbi:MAG: translation initiation factor IF-2 [Exilispira sp.]|jgi:translation initiation factor IF-2|nr:translation initiation factor IF-2 [Exilispira sp.]